MDIMDSKEVLEAQEHIFNDALCAISTSLRCAVQLGIPDIISHHDGPLTLSELVAKLSIRPEKSTHLYRLMRLLMHNGYFALQKNHHGEEGYVLTSLSKILVSRELKSNFSQMVLILTDPIIVTACLFTADWFRGASSSSFEAMNGMTLYEYFVKHADLGTRFNAAMGSSSEWVIKELLQAIKPMLEGFETLVDVGGGTGTVAKAIAEAAPHLRCTVYDRPNVISDIKDINNDITLVAGNMFEFVPSANVILIKSVLVDWSDMECLKILKRCKEAISREDCGRKVIIVDNVTDVGKVDSESMKTHSSIDVFAMNVCSGRERTEIEWKKIFMDAGFTSYKITPFVAYNSIIEVFP